MERRNFVVGSFFDRNSQWSAFVSRSELTRGVGNERSQSSSSHCPGRWTFDQANSTFSLGSVAINERPSPESQRPPKLYRAFAAAKRRLDAATRTYVHNGIILLLSRYLCRKRPNSRKPMRSDEGRCVGCTHVLEPFANYK